MCNFCPTFNFVGSTPGLASVIAFAETPPNFLPMVQSVVALHDRVILSGGGRGAGVSTTGGGLDAVVAGAGSGATTDWSASSVGATGDVFSVRRGSFGRGLITAAALHKHRQQTDRVNRENEKHRDLHSSATFVF